MKSLAHGRLRRPILAISGIALAATFGAWFLPDDKSPVATRLDATNAATQDRVAVGDPIPPIGAHTSERIVAPVPNPAASGSIAGPRAKLFPAVVPDAPAATLYERLVQSGTTMRQAADVARLNKALERCWSSSLHARIANSISAASSPEAHGQAQRLARQERLDANDVCADLSADAYTKADEWTAQLAAQGDPQSMFSYVQAYWVRDALTATREPERLVDYRRNALAYLDALIDQGYSDALVLMGSIRLNPTWGDPQPAEAWAYMYASARARGDTALQAKLLQGMEQRVPRASRQRASEFSEQPFVRCCRG